MSPVVVDSSQVEIRVSREGRGEHPPAAIGGRAECHRDRQFGHLSILFYTSLVFAAT